MKLTVYVSDEETGKVLFREDLQTDRDSYHFAVNLAATRIWRKLMTTLGKDWRNEQDPMGRPASPND